MWTVVQSRKPRRDGEAFLMRDGQFVMKVYKDAVPDVPAFAEWLAKQLNQVEEKRQSKSNSVSETSSCSPSR